ncbi:helix-turn-helix transcriptional regulator [Streptomyces albus subsp. chlorinus]|uniref:TetR/AcrR family transcriptional regulator n=1 Tax=Streptomyces albus TaxID=1888 RepID=UPI001570805D|nr:TetR family transcriptional regulator [Streptomyces albus]NSC20944.1 helix-turn-helix transcriptional regulator [Streptomyces albus subsp. chlorinus]
MPKPPPRTARPAAAPRGPLTREAVLDAAASLVRRDGPRALTMRGLAAELGTAATSIYWHVGNREALLEALVERTVRELDEIRPRGRTPRARMVSVARALRRELRARPHLIALVHERGLTERLFHTAQQALAREAHAAGLRGARAAEAVRAVQFSVVGHALLERNRERAPAQRPGEPALWERDPGTGDPALVRALATPPDTEKVFTVAVRALVDGLLPAPDPPSPSAG